MEQSKARSVWICTFKNFSSCSFATWRIRGYRFEGEGVAKGKADALAFGVFSRGATDVVVEDNRFDGTIQAITDAGGANPDSAKGLVHPRAYGSYPRILGKYVREEGVLTLEDAVRKMSSAVAERLSLRDRGLLREGMYADIVVFDPATIIDRATFAEPHRISTGVRDVFVNGVAVLRDGRHTGATPGKVVRGPGYGMK